MVGVAQGDEGQEVVGIVLESASCYKGPRSSFHTPSTPFTCAFLVIVCHALVAIVIQSKRWSSKTKSEINPFPEGYNFSTQEEAGNAFSLKERKAGIKCFVTMDPRWRWNFLESKFS